MATEVGQLVLKVDTTGVKNAEAAVERLGDAAQETTAKTEAMTASSRKGKVAVGDFGRKAGMAGVQVEQLANQIAMGQNPMRALGVQAADLGFVLGAPLLGAVVGIGAALASVLIPMLNRTSTGTEELVDQMDELGLKFREMTQAQQYVFLLEFNENLKELQDQSAAAADALEDLDRRERRINQNAAMDADARASALAVINEERNRLTAIIDNNAAATQAMTKALTDETEAERKLRLEREKTERQTQLRIEREARELERRTEQAQRHAERMAAMDDNELERIERREATEIAILEKNRQEKLISAQQYEEALISIRAWGAEQRYNIKLREDEQDRKMAEDRLARLHDENDSLMQEIIEQDEKKRESAAQTTSALLSLEDNLLKGKSEKQKAGFRLAVNLANAEKRENARSIVSNSYDAAMKAYKSLAGIPIVGPALGAAAAATILAAGVSYAAQSLSGRALGGQVRAGESYVVGERGPEILTMGTGGRITPNEAIGGGGQTVNKTANVSFNIQANDSQGFDELLANRRGLIIGMINEAMEDQGRVALI